MINPSEEQSGCPIDSDTTTSYDSKIPYLPWQATTSSKSHHGSDFLDGQGLASTPTADDITPTYNFLELSAINAPR
ncbi:hypothetical protein Nepgr_026728 [Nepenthes gracilis]|uniref:Uncharacterized protein n=1 Tax=Nepenthes gracilis TaxID=150966 RepID=A0AAD3Y2B0_NEPGR|nr:hypothetical protein Nepgr_026728 [Nepenthes gracilis]